MTNKDKESLLRKLLDHKDIKEKDTLSNLNIIAQIVDLSWDLGHLDGLSHAQNLSDQLLNTELSDSERSELFYYIANSWAAIRDIQNPESKRSFDWEIEEVEKELISLRTSAYHDGFADLPLGRRCQILTNLAGRLSELGRPLDALECWDKVLEEAPSFGMALGNRGIGVWKYAQHLYDRGHEALLLHEAEESLRKSCQSATTDPAALVYFEEELNRIPKVDIGDIKSKKFNLGDTDKEISYREWCLKNRLFINPLNDIFTNSIASCDVLSLPSITTKSSEIPSYFSKFNLLKQEYITARYLMYMAQESDEPHFADKDVSLVNTLDYQIYSIRIEYMKMVFRSAYSILDKIAFFLNDYFQLELNENRIYFRSVWYKNGFKKSGLNSKFKESQNWPLRGLFWLSKDIFEKETEFSSAISPDAKQLHELRNHLEHKYVTLHDILMSLDNEAHTSTDGIIPISPEDFYRKTLRILRLSRAAIVNLSMAINVEEERKRNQSNTEGIIASMPLCNVEHEWKRTWRN